MHKSLLTLAVIGALALPGIADPAPQPDDTEAAAALHDRVFAQGLWQAQQARTLTDPSAQADAAQRAIRLLQPYVEKGSMLASWSLGYLYLTGTGVAENRSLGITLYEQSAGGGNRVAARWLATALHHERPRTAVEIAENDAAEHFRQLAEAPGEDHVGPVLLAASAGLREGVVGGTARAVDQTIGKAVSHHVAPAATPVSVNTATTGGAQDTAASQSAPTADAAIKALQIKVAVLEKELSVLRARDQRLATRVDASRLNREAMLAITRHDYALALQKLEQASAKDYAPAQANLASLYLNGTGVARDPGKALRLYEKAAAAGNAVAAENMANILEYGVGVPRDHSRATKAFRRAADLGSPTALHALERLGVATIRR